MTCKTAISSAANNFTRANRALVGLLNRGQIERGHVAKDHDGDGLRDDPMFKSLIEGIGAISSA